MNYSAKSIVNQIWDNMKFQQRYMNASLVKSSLANSSCKFDVEYQLLFTSARFTFEVHRFIDVDEARVVSNSLVVVVVVAVVVVVVVNCRLRRKLWNISSRTSDTFQPVWPDVEIKSSPSFSKSYPKSSHTCLTVKGLVFTAAQKSHKTFGLLL